VKQGEKKQECVRHSVCWNEGRRIIKKGYHTACPYGCQSSFSYLSHAIREFDDIQI